MKHWQYRQRNGLFSIPALLRPLISKGCSCWILKGRVWAQQPSRLLCAWDPWEPVTFWFIKHKGTSSGFLTEGPRFKTYAVRANINMKWCLFVIWRGGISLSNSIYLTSICWAFTYALGTVKDARDTMINRKDMPLCLQSLISSEVETVHIQGNKWAR